MKRSAPLAFSGAAASVPAVGWPHRPKKDSGSKIVAQPVPEIRVAVRRIVDRLGGGALASAFA